MSTPPAPRDEVAPFVAKWERQARSLIGGVLSGDAVEALMHPLYGGGSPRVRMVDSPYAATELIATGTLGTPRPADDPWANPAAADNLVGDGRLAFDVSFTVWTALARERSRVHSQVEDRMRWSAGLRLGVFDDWYPIYEWLGVAHRNLVTDAQKDVLSLSWNLGWFWTFEDAVLVSQPPTAVSRGDGGPTILFSDGWSAVP